MKKLIVPIALLAALTACNNAPSGDKTEAGEKEEVTVAEGITYAADSTSTITWTGSKPTGSHIGTFTLNEGSFTVKDNMLTGGSFVINIASLTNKDLKEEDGKSKLEGHLKSPDFFDLEKYPTAKFEITGVTPFVYDSVANKDLATKDANYTIKGNLTLKDSTKNISFPARVNITADKVTAAADFNIDRTEWGLNYKGPNNPQDWFIRKEVNIKLDLKAGK